MKVITAEHAGFCFGVQRAIDKAKEVADTSSGRVYTYGPLIHNDSAIRDLEESNVYAVSTEADKGHKDSTVVIRAHGVAHGVYEKLEQNYSKIVDATCPFVKKIHRIVDEATKNDEQVVIAGQADHPEVVGIKGWTDGRAQVISEAGDIDSLRLDTAKRVCIVSQTTFRLNKFKELVEILEEKGYDIKAFNTICNATEERQQEAAVIAARVDAMLVLGGENSSNSKKLFEICKGLCENTYFLQTADDLNLSTLRSFDSIGITAGASTPHYIIEEVQKKCQK